MNRAEKRILRTVIYRVAHHNKHLWWELKRQIWNGGFQLYYPRQDEFNQTAERELSSLKSSEKQDLIIEWGKRNTHQQNWSEDQIVRGYVPLVIEEVVARATAAAYRTTNW